MRRLIGTGLCLATLLLAGCTTSGGDEQANNDTPDAKVTGLPAALFADAAPANAQPLGDVKQNAGIGDEVVFAGRIGGRVSPFVDGRAVFLIADSSLKICSELHGDTCKTPWDYCCEPRDNLVANTASVQIVDENGQPMKISLKGEHGLGETTTVIVTGTVSAKDDAGTFVVDATSLYVQQG